MLPNCFQSHHHLSPPRQTMQSLLHGRGTGTVSPQIQVEVASSNDEAPTASRSIYLREIHRQIDHNDMLQPRLANSTKLLQNEERIAMGDGKDPTP
jgi:hypothetical protein